VWHSVYFHSPHGAASAKLLFVHAVLRQPRCVHMHALALGGRLIGAGVKCKSFRDSFSRSCSCSRERESERVIPGCNKLTDHGGAGGIAGKLASAFANRLSPGKKKLALLLLLVCKIGCQVDSSATKELFCARHIQILFFICLHIFTVTRTDIGKLLRQCHYRSECNESFAYYIPTWNGVIVN
jgi:hypothetical protein